ncbi:MAG: patatin-like phospholipase family protein [Spirochaetota bacterium]|nr:patatin-like phospholipase family protein [Spirochaetota bacterium]
MLKNILLKKKIQKHGLGLALGGGSVRGFFHIGVLHALEELDIKISYIAGISIGSLIGGLYAVGYNSSQILDILNKQSQFKNLLNMASPTFFNKQGLFSGKHMILEINQLANFTLIENLKIPFSCRAVDLRYFKEVIFDSGDLGKAIKTSCSIPGIFTPEDNKESKLLVDGGVLGSVPLALLQSKFSGPTLASNLIDYSNINSDNAINLNSSFSENIIHKFVPFSDNILRSFYLMQSYITLLEYEKYNPDITIEFKETYYPSITNILQIKDQLVLDGYTKTKHKMQEIGF